MAAVKGTEEYKCHEPQESSTPFYTDGHLLPQAGGHVTDPCRRSLSGRNDLFL